MKILGTIYTDKFPEQNECIDSMKNSFLEILNIFNIFNSELTLKQSL